jgi:hypothetical protein
MPKTPKSTVAVEASADLLSIKDVVAASGLSEQYVRVALGKGKLETTKVPVHEGAKTMKNMITRSSFEAWRASASTHTKREDGRNKFVIYLSEDEAKHLVEVISGLPFAETLKRASIKPAAKTEA